jgi:hypothetical protein
MSMLSFKDINRKVKSKILGQVSDSDLITLKSELTDNHSLFGKHPDFHSGIKRFNAFDFTESLHILNLDLEFNLIEDNRKLFPNTLSLIEKYTGQSIDNLARCYWIKLEPSNFVRCHADTACVYHHTVNRYQIFLDVPRDLIVVTDGELWNMYPDKKLSNSVLLFNKEDYHYYANHTNGITCYMLVADFRFYSPEDSLPKPYAND